VLHARNPRLILCSLTPFGQTGPRADWRGSDLTVIALSGNLHCTGDPDRAPLRCSLPVSYYHGGIAVAAGVAFARLARGHSGEGAHPARRARSPLRGPLPVAYYQGGIKASAGVAFALLAREQSGEGQHVDVALQEAMVMPHIGAGATAKMT